MEELTQQRAHSDTPPIKRHLRNFLIDKDFQLRWVRNVVLVVALIVLGMGYFLYGTVSEATEQMVVQKLGDPMLTEAAQTAFIEQAARDKQATLVKLIGGLALLVVVLGMLTIVATHKIAGPAYKMRKIFGTINGDKLQTWEKLRKADELQNAFVDFDSMLRRIREGRQQDTAEIEACMVLVEQGSGDEAVSRLEDIVERYKRSVTMD